VIVDFHGSDDAAVVRFDGENAIVQTVDFFTPIVDDPYAFGQIAAANSLSDIYAMGADPLFALNIVAFPSKDLPMETLAEILLGGSDKAKEAGISIVGGHSIDDKEPKYGLVVTGRGVVGELVQNSTAQEGDTLILTKPLGTGIIATAIKRGIAPEEMVTEATAIMSTLNRTAADLMLKHGAHAATDVTGYGLLGHLLEMCQASSVTAEVNFDSLQFIDGVEELALKDVIPGGSERNFDFVSPHIKFPDDLPQHRKIMTADAQTSGGLLISLPEESAQNFLDDFSENSSNLAFQIGTIREKSKHSIIIS
jgi:selenide,water dikinase